MQSFVVGIHYYVLSTKLYCIVPVLEYWLVCYSMICYVTIANPEVVLSFHWLMEEDLLIILSLASSSLLGSYHTYLGMIDAARYSQRKASRLLLYIAVLVTCESNLVVVICGYSW